MGNAHGIGNENILRALKGHDNLQRRFVLPFQGNLSGGATMTVGDAHGYVVVPLCGTRPMIMNGNLAAC